MPVCMQTMYVPSAWEGPKRAPDPLKLELPLWDFIWTLETIDGKSARVASALNFWVTSPSLSHFYLP